MLAMRIEHQSSLDVLAARGGTPPRWRPAPRVREVHAGDCVDGRTWKVTVGHAAHVQPFLECLAFRIDSTDGSVCYSGDSGMCDELVELARGCDVLIHMNHYVSGTEPSASYRAACGNHRDNASVARRAGVGTMVLTHLPQELGEPGTRSQAEREIREEFDGRVVWGEDLMVITVEKGIVKVRGSVGPTDCS